MQHVPCVASKPRGRSFLVLLLKFGCSFQERYTGLHTYDLLTHSCNHFSNEVRDSQVLLLRAVELGFCQPFVMPRRCVLSCWDKGFPRRFLNSRVFAATTALEAFILQACSQLHECMQEDFSVRANRSTAIGSQRTAIHIVHSCASMTPSHHMKSSGVWR